MTVRAKFVLAEIHTYHWSKDSKNFVFTPQYDSSIPEDQRFYESTPTGKFEMRVNNPAVIANFKMGQAYYFDITEVPAAIPAPEAPKA